jgi:opacity protein-like surface antigen
MKKLALLALLATSLVTSASAALTAGLEAAYLTDDQEAYWAARVGWEFKATSSLSHQLEFEIGHTEHKEGDFGLTFKTKLTPFTLNYRAETTAANKLGFYFGAGVGQSYVEYSVLSFSDDATALTFQAFVGLNYKATPAATLHLGVKFLRVGDADFDVGTIEVGNDTALTAGVSIRF